MDQVERGSTAAQVRRDLMTIGFTGSPAKGYDIASMIQTIGGSAPTPRRNDTWPTPII